MSEKHPMPTEINLHQKSRMLEIAFDDGEKFELSCEYLRCFHPLQKYRDMGRARRPCR